MKGMMMLIVLLCLWSVRAQPFIPWNETIAQGKSGSPAIRYYNTLTLIPNTTRALLFAGATYDSVTDRTFNLDDSWYLEMSNKSWIDLKPTTRPPGRGYFTGVANTKEVIIYGGRTERPIGFLSDTWRFDVMKQTWSQDVYLGTVKPPTKSFHSGVLVGELVYYFGGYNAEIAMVANDLYAYNITAHSWHLLINNGAAGSPAARQGHVGVYSHDRTLGEGFIIFGGYDTKGGMNDAWRYNIASNKWTQIEFTSGVALPPGRFGASGASTNYGNVNGTEVIIFGGEATLQNNEPYFNDVWSLKVVGNAGTWTRLVEDGSIQGPGERSGQSAVIYDKHYYVFAGYRQYAGLRNDLWALNYVV